RAGGQQLLRAPLLGDAPGVLLAALARLLAQHDVAAAAQRVVERAMLPHHALRHAGGAARVHEEQVARIAADVEALVAAAAHDLAPADREGVALGAVLD